MQPKLNKKLKGLEVFRTITIIHRARLVSEDEKNVDGIDYSKNVVVFTGILHNGIVGYNLYYDDKLFHTNHTGSFIDNEIAKSNKENSAIIEDAYQFIDNNIGFVCYGENEYYNPILYAPELRELEEICEILSKASKNINNLYYYRNNYDAKASIKLIFGGEGYNDSKLSDDELEHINNLTLQFVSCKYLHSKTSKFIFNKENLNLIMKEFEQYYNNIRTKYNYLRNQHFHFLNSKSHKLLN